MAARCALLVVAVGAALRTCTGAVTVKKCYKPRSGGDTPSCEGAPTADETELCNLDYKEFRDAALTAAGPGATVTEDCADSGCLEISVVDGAIPVESSIGNSSSTVPTRHGGSTGTETAETCFDESEECSTSTSSDKAKAACAAALVGVKQQYNDADATEYVDNCASTACFTSKWYLKSDCADTEAVSNLCLKVGEVYSSTKCTSRRQRRFIEFNCALVAPLFQVPADDVDNTGEEVCIKIDRTNTYDKDWAYNGLVTCVETASNPASTVGAAVATVAVPLVFSMLAL
jgi:hypothetical protein